MSQEVNETTQISQDRDDGSWDDVDGLELDY